MKFSSLSGRISYYFPLSLIGTPLALGMLLLLGNAFATANPFAYLLSLAGLGLLVLVTVSGRLQAGRISDQQLAWNSNHRIYAGRGPAPHTLELRSARLLPFFRLRYSLNGQIRSGNAVLGRHFRSGRFKPGRNGGIPLPTALPHCGVYHATLNIAVEDIFGLSRSRTGAVLTRTVPVLPGVFGRPVAYRIADRGAEEKNRMQESEVERYYMREYTPGDRFRDINWKASSRGDKLFTRISPVAQEETTTVTLAARFYAADTRLSPALLALAEYQKSWIISFILKVREEHPDFIFQVFLNSKEFLLESDEEIERFAVSLGDTWFEEPGSRLPALPQEGQVYLFTTAADEGLSLLHTAFPRLETDLHLSRIATREERRSGSAESFALYPNYTGEELPSLPLMAGMLHSARFLRRRIPRTSGEAILKPVFDVRKKTHPV